MIDLITKWNAIAANRRATDPILAEAIERELLPALAAKDAEIARLTALRLHCDRCGADYAATGIEAGCPCQLTELLRSAHAIAERRGADTAWQRFATSIQALGIGSVTARTYRVLPSDEEASESALAAAQRECDRLREERDAADASARQLQERVQRLVDGAVAERQKVAALRAAAAGYKIAVRPWLDRAAGLPGTVTFLEWSTALERLDAALGLTSTEPTPEGQ